MTSSGGRRAKQRRWLAFAALAVGVALAVVAAVGHSRPIPSPSSIGSDHFDPELAGRARSLELLLGAAGAGAASELAPPSPAARMARLFDVVTARLRQGRAEHTLWSNWIMWLAGKVRPSLGAIRDPDVLLRVSDTALCGGSSYTLVQLALRDGVRARHVGLDGHVVMEAWYDGGWHMYDPDYEVVPLVDGVVLSVSALERDAGAIDSAYGARAELVRGILMSVENNTYVSVPAGAQFHWKAEVALRFERLAEILKLVVPIVLIGVGLALRRSAAT